MQQPLFLHTGWVNIRNTINLHTINQQNHKQLHQKHVHEDWKYSVAVVLVLAS